MSNVNGRHVLVAHEKRGGLALAFGEDAEVRGDELVGDVTASANAAKDVGRVDVSVREAARVQGEERVLDLLQRAHSLGRPRGEQGVILEHVG